VARDQGLDMKFIATTLMVACVLSRLSFADSSQDTAQAKAERELETCVRGGKGSKDACRHQAKDIDILITGYKGGDKSVLPVLFHFSYLTDFYGDALTADPNTFLAALANLPADEREWAERGLAGGNSWIKTKERFEALRKVLEDVPAGSPTKDIAQACLAKLETQNAAYLAAYFPPNTFTSRIADRRVFGLSSTLYSLGQKPLWPPVSLAETSYRLVYIGSRLPNIKMVQITAQSDGAARIDAKDEGIGSKPYDETRTIDTDHLTKFLERVDNANFWQMATESPNLGLDGAEWILEGVQNGKYHVVVRWCPGEFHDNDHAFAYAARLMFELAGHEHHGGC
jgi:hypothetical protein